MADEADKFDKDDEVVDHTRLQLWGNTKGRVLKKMGPFRVMVQWPDARGSQLEKNSDLSFFGEGV